VSGREGAARKFNLDFYCKAFDFEIVRSNDGPLASGHHVSVLLYQGSGLVTVVQQL